MNNAQCQIQIMASTAEAVTDEEVRQAVEEIAASVRSQIEELKEQQKEQAKLIREKINEIAKCILGDRPLEPLNTPQRWPSDNVDKQVEWIKTEFAQMVTEIEEEKESMERFEEELDRECEEVMEDMARRGKKLNQEIQEVKDLHRQVKAALNEKLRKFREDMLAINKPLEELLSQLRKLWASNKKLNEESFDRYLETERVIEAMEEAIETETYELKIEKSYKSGLVPGWAHPSLSKVSWAVTPVYRTIKGFQKKKADLISFTEPFYTTRGGYKMTLGVYPNGHGSGQGSHVSIYIRLMKGDNDNVLPFPFTGNVIIEALNWSEDDGHAERIIAFYESAQLGCRQRVTDGDMAKMGRGNGEFLSHLNLQQYLLNDMMCLRVSFEGIHFTGSPVPSWYNTMINSSIPPCTVTMFQYSRLKKTNSAWTSKPFYTSERGYKLQLGVDACGTGSGTGTHVSVVVRLMKGEYDEQLQWPFNATITVQLLNWSHDSNHIEETIPHFKAPIKDRTRIIEGSIAPGGWGVEQFISHSNLNNADGIRYISETDKLCFRITDIIILDGCNLQ